MGGSDFETSRGWVGGRTGCCVHSVDLMPLEPGCGTRAPPTLSSFQLCRLYVSPDPPAPLPVALSHMVKGLEAEQVRGSCINGGWEGRVGFVVLTSLVELGP